MIINPQGKQIEVLALPAEGHIVVLGTAGSGKTTIALLRAINLANIPGNEKVLLVTFNKALVEYMKSFGKGCKNLTVENYHKFARGYMSSRNRMSKNGVIINNEERQELIKTAVQDIQTKNPTEATLKRKLAFFYDEIQFIEEYGCSTFEKYASIERTGRAEANLKKEKRPYLYQVYERYLELRNLRGKQYDWFDLAMYVTEELDNDKGKRYYKHVIVDEGQDFSPMMIRSLVKAIPQDGSFTFFGDVAQQIYGNRISWKESGIRTDRVWRFTKNYRNPETVVLFAKELEKSTYWKHSDDMVECESSNAKGPKPVLIRFNTEKEEREWIAERAIKESLKSSVVIVCRNRNDIDIYLKMLQGKGYNAIEIDRNTPGFGDQKKVYLSTFHGASVA